MCLLIVRTCFCCNKNDRNSPSANVMFCLRFDYNVNKAPRGKETEIFKEDNIEFYVLLTVHLITVFVNDKLDAQFCFLYSFIPILYMFRAIKCSSSGESIVSIRPLVYVTVCR